MRLLKRTPNALLLIAILCSTTMNGQAGAESRSEQTTAQGGASTLSARIIALHESTRTVRVCRSNVEDFRIKVLLQLPNQRYFAWFDTTSGKAARDLRASLCQEVKIEISGSKIRTILPSGRKLPLHLVAESETWSNKVFTNQCP
jgi:hypothetical protein